METGMPGVRAPMLHQPRRAVPRACVLDDKPHVRTFISDMLDELGFFTVAAPQALDVRTMLETTHPSLVVVSVPDASSAAPGVLIRLAAEGYRGNVMLFGGRASSALMSAHELGEKLRLAMLPPLGTPFRDGDLAENLSTFLPIRPAIAAPVDVAEALQADWLELWYQPKVDPHRMTLRGAEALIRMRHPLLGVVPPAYFIPPPGDPKLRTLSEFVVRQAAADWRGFAEGGAPVEIAVNLPMVMLEDGAFVDGMRTHLPDHPAFPGLVVEVGSAEVMRDPDLACALARQIADRCIRISVEDAAAACPALAALPDLPFAELKVDWRLIEGCTDALKRAVCLPVIELAERAGCAAVAVGIETPAALEAVRDMGFALVQGFLFAGPMDAGKFARTMLIRRNVALG